MSEFLSMGGHGVFIWSAYGVAAVVLGGLLAVSLRDMLRGEATVEALRTALRDEADK
jgi:heme exporter protein CcmD